MTLEGFSILIAHSPESELWNCDAKELTRFALHQVGTLHGSFHRFQDAERIVFVMAARLDHRLLAYDSFTLNLFHPSARMPDEPMAAQKLNLPGGVILNPDKVRKDKLALQCIGLSIHEHRTDSDADAFCDCGVGCHTYSQQGTSKAREPQVF